jgi:arylsulfatase A-like enzyme/Flp pilus assembly protein TadD
MRWITVLLLMTTVGVAADTAQGPLPDVVLVTLDTTRADALGAYGGDGAATPVLDRLAALGVRYRTAISPAPLTLPAHATILTGLDPPEHGVRSNGGEVLSGSVPTIATALAGHGRITAAFIASRVLDHRFGLARGFDHYDDSMVAENTGEYGYPERDARAVTDAALEWLDGEAATDPFFLWVHYYDPHAPYAPPAGFGGATQRAAYLGEVSFVDRQIGRLLNALPRGLSNTVVVVVGDHGEALGDHGERSHGIFLYRGVTEVPLIIAGRSVPTGKVVGEPVALRQLAATVLRLAATRDHPISRRTGLPWPGEEVTDPAPIYAEATMPKTAYGWAPLRSVVADGLKYIDAPRPELYDLRTDPQETRNLAVDRRDDASRLEALLDDLTAGMVAADPAPSPEIDAETRAALRSLGYVVETPEGAGDGIDPKDGVKLLAELDAATGQLRSGAVEPAVDGLAALVEKNPHNAVFQSRYGEALLAAGRGPDAINAYRAAVNLRPRSEFALKNLGDALSALGRKEEARAAYVEALELDPRSAPNWLRLADLAENDQRTALLRRAVEAGTESVTVYLRLAEAQVKTNPETAVTACRRASELAPLAAEPALCLGMAYLAQGTPERAAPNLRRAAVLGRGGKTAERAEELLAEIELDQRP